MNPPINKDAPPMNRTTIIIQSNEYVSLGRVGGNIIPRANHPSINKPSTMNASPFNTDPINLSFFPASYQSLFPPSFCLKHLHFSGR
jgi:hypothetical protein